MAHILIVEDEAHIAQMIEATLSLWGYTSEICSDGEKAVERIFAGGFDLVLLDVMLPGLDGFAVMERVAPTYRLLAVHSELNQYVAAETKRRMDAGENGLKAFCRSRPVEAETAAVAWVIEAARKTGCRASVCHVSTPEAVRMIEAARAQGVRVWAETCPQYILFHEQSAAHAGVFARMKPPLRDEQRMRQLRRMYENG